MTSNGVNPVPTNQPPGQTIAAMDDLPFEPFPPPPDPVRFPNNRLRPSTSFRPRPRTPSDPSPADTDSCRICRGEGTPEEPLFYPCKCSGSIKYVHQDCLMEWLSHSQKKHCELCKTPFRFTKLYDPDMPATLPFHVFARHTAKYLARALLSWLRAALVANVWLGWLPYLMRAVWSFLFWISDEGLGSRPPSHAAAAAADALERLSGALPLGLGVCPATPLLAATPSSTTTPATLAGVLERLPPASAKFVRGLFSVNLTSADPVYASVLRLLFGSATDPEPLPRPQGRRHTLLSGVEFLQNLTRHPSVNRAIVDVLEGQVITILVIVSFILIILVRDYVVQQQPDINMRAFNEDPLVVQEQAPRNHQPEPQPAQEAQPAPEPEPEPDSSDSGTIEDPQFVVWPRPSLQGAADAPQDDPSTVHEYLEIYREAGGDPEKILRLARERNLEGRLDYWLRLTRTTMTDRTNAEQHNATTSQAAPGPGIASSQNGIPGSSSLPNIPLGRDPEDANDPAMGVRLRPRANTDGPPMHRPVNPLANNVWSFDELPIPRPTESDSSDSLPATLAEPEDLPRPDEPPAPPRVEQPQPADETQTRPPRDGLAGRLLDFMFREVDVIPTTELAAVTRKGDFGVDEEEEDANQQQDQDPDGQAIDDEEAEDLEGILELLGMRGPLVSLFQNALFCSVLVSITIFLGVFVPYNIGRVVIWALANPVRIAKILFGMARFLQDIALFIVSLGSAAISGALYVIGRFLMVPRIADLAWNIARASLATAKATYFRVNTVVDYDVPLLSPAEVRNFSAISHEALQVLKHHISAVVLVPVRLLGLLGGEVPTFTTITGAAWVVLEHVRSALRPSAWVIDLKPEAVASAPINLSLAHWGAADRFLAIMAGYIAVSVAAALYLKRGVPISTAPAAQDWEATLLDGLHQASGVVKVIFIISIEMLVFPLYCGLLLDVALLPLFENATIQSRILFTMRYPVTSLFVHWFVGTAYMFHFALFVSMCRKIMRKGVLHFIRDPDDPEFHPVRDVLERTVATQLRKILFSAFVYGALVIVCLGGVVWGLALALPGTLPIRYSSDQPVLEFPIDLLFYNFAMPLAVKFFQPSAGLHAMYTWWFRRCARALRITWFLFGECRVDEEGQLVLRPDSPDRNLPFWRRWFLEVDKSNNVVARSWHGIFEGGAAPRDDLQFKPEADFVRHATKDALKRSGQLIPDGRFVRAPASGQVKIPKGAPVFIDVTEHNVRLDGKPDREETDVYSTDQYQLVYIPPNFRLRISIFILLIWLFAAVTGVGITIVPLEFGRWMLRRMLPPEVRTNDIYAFSMGLHVLGVGLYLMVRSRPLIAIALGYLGRAADRVRREGINRVVSTVSRVARCVYVYSVVFGVFPLLVASLIELYALVPLHEILHGTKLRLGQAFDPSPTAQHTVRIVQTWTIGLVYLKLAMRILNTWFLGSPMSNASRAVIRRGYSDPDATIFTKSFVAPLLTFWAAAIAAPLFLARVAVADGLPDFIASRYGPAAGSGESNNEALHQACVVLVYRFSFPAVALALAGVAAGWGAVGVAHRWKGRIRDEAYLIGERLHNFGGSSAPKGSRVAWRGTGRI
jgi:E3 ubiquitin-protein ligase MARCH6